MSKLKICFIPTNVSGVVFYRVWQPAQVMMRSKKDKVAVWWWDPKQFDMHPWEWEIHTNDKGPSIRRDLEMACDWADVVIWMGLHTPMSLNFFHEMKVKHDKPFVSEMDDYIFSVPLKNPAWPYFRPGTDYTKIALDQIKSSDGLIVSTPYLADLYRPFNSNVRVVENAIDLSLWRRHSSPGRRRVTLGWVGGATHEDDLLMVKDALYNVLERNKAQLVCLHGFPAEFEGHKRIICPRSKTRINEDGQHERTFKAIDKYPKWVCKQKFDIGIAPLVDNNFNRGKSNLRWLEYSAQGIPTVASPLPHFTESIRHGETGLIANGYDEWTSCLERLINDPTLREIGKNAREEVKQRWNPTLLGRKYRTVIEEMINAKPNEGRYRLADRGLDQRPEQHPLDGASETEQGSGSPRAVCS